jgi:glycosyltransferase involved in cell wall biosynthesis
LLQLFEVIEKYIDIRTEIEVIIVDSSDSLLEATRFSSYHHIPNLGPSYARNYGASKATSEWIIFCDADDIPNPFMLRDAITLLPGHVDAVFFEYRNEDDEVIVANSKKYFNGYIKSDSINLEPATDIIYFLQIFYPVHAVILKRETFNKIKFNEGQWFIEDVRLYIEMALLPSAKLMYCRDKEFMSFHRKFKNRQSLSTSNEPLFWEGVCYNFQLLTEKSSLKIIPKFKLTKLALLNFHSVNKNLQKFILQRNRNIFDYFFGLPHLLRNRTLFNIVITFTRIRR